MSHNDVVLNIDRMPMSRWPQGPFCRIPVQSPTGKRIHAAFRYEATELIDWLWKGMRLRASLGQILDDWHHISGLDYETWTPQMKAELHHWVADPASGTATS